ncbi:MAG: ergothioneine biosynthesis protein EgtB [Planctomycetes bacterium]|nr:ergothioneine biosynthesis protein EgtB [Planctomycetota bacterium]
MNSEAPGGISQKGLREQYGQVRRLTEELCAPLAIEDYVVQSMPDASPAKWHLAHTSWFFETFLLQVALADYHPFHAQYGYLFNSYYNAVGERVPRPQRGLLSRPTVGEVYTYRAYVDEHMAKLLDNLSGESLERLLPIFILGLNHEQQHQELLLTDIKHLFGCNPLRPVYRENEPVTGSAVPPLRWVNYPAGLRWIGHEGGSFGFDNEFPRHQVFVELFQLASRLTTNGEYLAFLEAGGYERPEFWLSDGWNARGLHHWQAPLYWEKHGSEWWTLTLAGMRPVVEAEPVCHVSYYEADAFARWSGARLPTEAEWETAALNCPLRGNFLESGGLHPLPIANSTNGTVLEQMFGDVWQWTSSAYLPYPGFRATAGALGEYNAKFMCGQLILRGGSCATPAAHIRKTYRNFFPPDARWQFSGIRLAKDTEG